MEGEGTAVIKPSLRSMRKLESCSLKTFVEETSVTRTLHRCVFDRTCIICCVCC